MGLRVGLLSTARINARSCAGARETDGADVVAVGVARRRARRRLRARARHRARARLLRGAAGRPRRRRGLHLAARTRCTSSGRSARSRPASTCCARSRSRAARREVERAFDAAERAGRVLTEAFMWRHHPQARAAARAGRRGVGELRVVRARVLVRSARAGRRPPQPRARGRGADGRRLLLRQRRALRRRRAGGVRRQQVRRRRRRRRVRGR